MRKKFLELQQRDRSVDAYAAEFVKLSRFALILVSDEEEKTHIFQQRLRNYLREHLVGHKYKTYLEIFEVVCCLEQVTKEGKLVTFKRPFNQRASSS